MAGPRRPPAAPSLLRGAAFLSLLLSAFVFLVGYVEEWAYFERLGIPANQIDFPAPHYMASSMSSLLVPITIFVTVLVLEYAFVGKLNGNRESQEFFAVFSPVATASAVAVYWLGFQFAALGDAPSIGWLRNHIPYTNVSGLDVLVHLCFVTLAVAILSGQVRQRWDGIYSYLFGRKRSAQVWLALIATASLLMAAGVAGTDRGNDAAWAASGCASVPVATFSPTPTQLEEGHQYWLVLRQGDLYYLRDLATDPMDRNLTLVRADTIDHVALHWTPAAVPC